MRESAGLLVEGGLRDSNTSEGGSTVNGPLWRHIPLPDVLDIWRSGIRFRQHQGGMITAVADDRGEPTDIPASLWPFVRIRLRKPTGWPADVPFPPEWWDEIALGFRITQATRHECPRCGFPVAVYVAPPGPRAWFCPQCGHPAPRPQKPLRPGADKTRQNRISGR